MRRHPGSLAGARRLALAAALATLCAVSARAGEFYEKEGVAIKGYDPVQNWPEVSRQTTVIE